jgi:hypothetical protein
MTEEIPNLERQTADDSDCRLPSVVPAAVCRPPSAVPIETREANRP